MKAAKFDYVAAEDFDDALARIAGGGKPVSGSQSLGPMLNMRLATPDLLVDLRRLPELRGYRQEGERLIIGAAVTHAEIEDGALPDATRGMLPFVAADIAYRPVRTRGTVGGSLCHADPAADWPTAMTALGAAMILAGADGQRGVAMDDFMQGAFATVLRAGEILVAVEVPVLSDEARWGYYKFCRKTGEFAETICGAVFDPVHDIKRVVLGGLGGAPRRLAPLEADPQADEPAIAAAIDGLGIAMEAAQRAMHIASVKRALARVGAS